VAHEHEWVELYRSIPWTVDDFDRDLLNPHRARYALDHPDESLRGQPHSDEDHYKSIPLPVPKIVVKCYGCDTCEEIPIPGGAYKRIVNQLVTGEIQENDPNAGNELSAMPLEQLLPELKDKLTEYGLIGKTGTARIRTLGDDVIRSGLDGEAALQNDARLRKQLGLPAREAADEAARAEWDKTVKAGKKGSTQPAGANDAPGSELAPELRGMVE
jgi:hypothetical protein